MAGYLGSIFKGVGEGIKDRRQNKTDLLKLMMLNEEKKRQLEIQQEQADTQRGYREDQAKQNAFENSDVYTPEELKAQESTGDSFLDAWRGKLKRKEVPAYLGAYQRLQTAKETSKGKGNEKEDFKSEAQSALAQMDELLKAVPSGLLGGGLAKLGGMTGQGFPEADAYESFKPAIAVKIYRGATGDKRLSDNDAKKRALPMLPNLTDSELNKKKKREFLDKLIAGEAPIPESWKSKDTNTQTSTEAPINDPKAALLKRKAELEAKARGGK